jgi:ankyrin repeat protein
MALQQISQEQKDLVNKEMFTALQQGDLDLFKLCIEKGADINAKNFAGQTPLIIVVSEGRSDVWFDFIMRQKPDLEAQDINGETALMRAVKLAAAQRLEILVAQKQDLFLKNGKKETVFDIANSLSESRKTKLIKMLLQALPDATVAAAAPAAPAAKGAFNEEAGLKDDIKAPVPLHIEQRKPNP